jgi:hypothetical protein
VAFERVRFVPHASRSALVVVLTVVALAAASVWSWWSWAGHARSHASAEELALAGQHAVRAIRLHQAPEGYWLTPHTTGPIFEQPVLEVNTFVPAIMADLLQPIAPETGLSDVLARAHGYLSRQIEETGLVRYHGRPDQPYIPRLGCAITPDSDDTALVWRLAPPEDTSRLQSALRVLAQYRTREGLYRTWLASPEGYQCLDPGRDPNPADIGINMHLYLFFAKYEPESARQLCDALRRAIPDDRVWVYYEVAPLVPILREADLSRAGCDVRVPAIRLHRAPAGQDAYIALSRLSRALRQNDAPPPALDTAVEALRRLANANFSELTRNPPLLYHNDFSATTPRFYWSVDAGYALWLRLYVETARRLAPPLLPPVR